MEKTLYKKCFKEKIQNGYQFFYINKDNTIMEYCLKRDFCIREESIGSSIGFI